MLSLNSIVEEALNYLGFPVEFPCRHGLLGSIGKLGAPSSCLSHLYHDIFGLG